MHIRNLRGNAKEEAMKIIFLDIDGVLNSHAYMTKMGELWDDPANQIDPELVARLNKITDATGAKLVISSTWRLPFLDYCRIDMLAELMASYGITGEVIGMTPAIGMTGSNERRGREIAIWLADNLYFKVETFIVLDDDFVDCEPITKAARGRGFPETFKASQIKPLLADGLQDDHVYEAMGILGTPEEGEQP
jgi:hypothetical protein